MLGRATCLLSIASAGQTFTCSVWLTPWLFAGCALRGDARRGRYLDGTLPLCSAADLQVRRRYRMAWFKI